MYKFVYLFMDVCMYKSVKGCAISLTNLSSSSRMVNFVAFPRTQGGSVVVCCADEWCKAAFSIFLSFTAHSTVPSFLSFFQVVNSFLILAGRYKIWR